MNHDLKDPKQIPEGEHWAIIGQGYEYAYQEGHDGEAGDQTRIEFLTYNFFLSEQQFSAQLESRLKAGQNVRGIHIANTYKPQTTISVVRTP